MAAAIEARGDVLVADPVVVVADRTGRLEGRTTAAGGAIAAGDVVFEFSDAPDPTDELRIDILEIAREIADLDGLADEVARLDSETGQRCRPDGVHPDDVAGRALAAHHRCA